MYLVVSPASEGAIQKIVKHRVHSIVPRSKSIVGRQRIMPTMVFQYKASRFRYATTCICPPTQNQHLVLASSDALPVSRSGRSKHSHACGPASSSPSSRTYLRISDKEMTPRSRLSSSTTMSLWTRLLRTVSKMLSSLSPSPHV